MVQLKLIIAFLFLIGTSYSTAQTVDSNVIYWAENKKLCYRSYQFIMPADSIVDANGREIGFAATGVRIGHDFYIRNGYLEYDIPAYVQLKGSYIMPDTILGKSLDYVLHHEQTHFDISELYARKMRQYLYNSPDKCNEDLVERALDSLYSAHWRKQESYDIQTSFNPQIQKEWDSDIKKELELLNKYKSRKGRIKCGAKAK